MGNLDKYFKGQQTHEELICFFRQHWIVMIREFVFFVFFAAIWTLAVINMNNIISFVNNTPGMETILVVGYVIATIYVHYFFLKFLNYFIRVGIITDIRLIDHKKTIYFIDTLETTELNNIQNMEQVSEGFLPNILGYGDLKIYLAASSTVKTFFRVPNPQFHFRCISRQKEERQRMMREREPAGLNYAQNLVDDKSKVKYFN